MHDETYHRLAFVYMVIVATATTRQGFCVLRTTTPEPQFRRQHSPSTCKLASPQLSATTHLHRFTTSFFGRQKRTAQLRLLCSLQDPLCPTSATFTASFKQHSNPHLQHVRQLFVQLVWPRSWPPFVLLRSVVCLSRCGDFS
jgi:hypothetical protein